MCVLLFVCMKIKILCEPVSVGEAVKCFRGFSPPLICMGFFALRTNS